MKKIFIIMMFSVLLLCGCGKVNNDNIIKDLSKKIDDINSYHLSGTLEIYRNEDKYVYDVNSSYKKGDLYKVDLVNQTNNHQQIILKNNEGVYVITPSLNKSFKFQSDWPYNNSQIYLLQPIISDLTSDKERTIEKTTNGYVLTSKVNYTSEKDFNIQKVYLDKDKNILKIEVLDDDQNVKMQLKIIDIDYKSKFDNDYFSTTKYLSEVDKDKDISSSKIEDIVYPMYVPIDTQLSGQDIIETSDGERVILTFSGESAFTMVQETYNDVNGTEYIYGDPYLILDTVGCLTDSSISWVSNGVEYSVMSDTMDVDELLTVAQSITVKSVGK